MPNDVKSFFLGPGSRGDMFPVRFQEQFLTSQQVRVLSPCYSMYSLWYASGSLLETQILTSIQDLLGQNLHFNENLRSTTEDKRVLNAGM